MNILAKTAAATFTGLTLLAYTGVVSASPYEYRKHSAKGKSVVSMQAVKKSLARRGFKVRRIKWDDGYYEAYAINARGHLLEIKINPRNGKIFKIERED